MIVQVKYVLPTLVGSMYWYEKYINNKIKSDSFFILYDEKLYDLYESCTPTKSNGIRWFYYIIQNKKFKRLYNKDIYFKYKMLNRKQAKDLFPEEFI